MQRYAITERLALSSHPEGPYGALAGQVAHWVAGGVEWVQIREKDLHPGELKELTRVLATLTHGSGTRLMLNGLPPAEARACGADGVHLPGDATAAAIRSAVQEIGLVSVSCHAGEETEAARESGASALLWAPVFGKAVEGRPVAPGTGLVMLAEACRRAAPVPVFALGGVTAENAQQCVAAGAAGVAGIRLFAGEHWRDLG